MKNPYDKIEKTFDKIDDLIGNLKFQVEQALQNAEHAKERLEADLSQGFYFDGKNAYELIKKGKSIKRKKIKND